MATHAVAMKAHFSVIIRLIVVALLSAFLGCRNDELKRAHEIAHAERSRREQAEAENRKLKERIDQSGQATVAFADTVSAVEAALQKLGAVDRTLHEKVSDAEGAVRIGSTRIHLMALADDLERQMNARNQRVAELEAALRTAQAAPKPNERAARQRLADIEKRAQHELAKTTAIYEQQIVHLHARILELERHNAHQGAVISSQGAEISQIQASSARIRYVIGSGRKLWQQGMLRGSRFGRKSPDCSGCPSCFTVGDSRELQAIPIPAALRRVRVFTSHTPTSYNLRQVGPSATELSITDSDAFWHDSKCLVIGY